MQIATILIGVLVDAFIIVLFILEFKNYRDLRKTFTCPHCHTMIDTLRDKNRCSNCKRTFKIEDKEWHHFIIHRRTEIKKHSGGVTYHYKSYAQYCKVEMAISLICAIIISAFLISSVI